MNREIKVRAWYEKSQSWVYLSINRGFATNTALEIYNEINLNGGAWYQFTGLKDKNGKEIYEGDVVEFLYKNPESQEKLAPVSCEVVWSDEGAWALKWPDGYINGARLQPKKYTVIGNIYENKQP